MKGIIFTEFLDFVTSAHGEDFVDDLIDDSGVPSGAYTAVGTYEFKEMQALVVALSQKSATPVPDLLSSFGFYLCGRFVDLFPQFFDAERSLFDFIDSDIHIEVNKLYPYAELPKFSIHTRDERRLELDYRSCRPLEALAEGMILAAAHRYSQPVRVSKNRHENGKDPMVRFTIEYAESL